MENLLRGGKMNLKTIILAAGQGTRMKSKLPKVLHKVCGIEMVNHIIEISRQLGADENVVVVGHMAETVKESLPKEVKTVLQSEQLGTGHAVKMANEYIDDSQILVLCGDTPLVKPETLKNLVEEHVKNENKATVLTTHVHKPTGYGRIVRDASGLVSKIVEEKDADEKTKIIKEINSGIYVFDGKLLKEALSNLSNDNAQGEYYLTDVIGMLKDGSHRVAACSDSTIEELMGVNSKVDLARAQEIMRRRINEKLMMEGAIIIDPASTYIEAKVKIGRDSVIYPSTLITGDTVIGEECVIGIGSRIENSKLGNNIEVQNSTILDSVIDDNSNVGPYAYLRPNSKIGKNVKIGDFVEVKNSVVGDNTKASHLTYIGDADLGKDINLGCGVVFVNYDGKNKYRSTIEDGAFIGCNTNIVSPVHVEEGAYIAAGSTITEDVPKDSLAIARARQVNKTNWKK